LRASTGYTRVQDALKNLGHCVARSTIARILKEQGIPPSGEADVVADVSSGALDRRLHGGFLHPRGLD
jgi:hypothetical protein